MTVYTVPIGDEAAEWMARHDTAAAGNEVRLEAPGDGTLRFTENGLWWLTRDVDGDPAVILDGNGLCLWVDGWPHPLDSPDARRLKLTDAQQEAIEQAKAEPDLPYAFYVPTPPARRYRTRNATAVALVAKGVFELVEHGMHDSVYRLTLFGHVVYQQHPKIIRR